LHSPLSLKKDKKIEPPIATLLIAKRKAISHRERFLEMAGYTGLFEHWAKFYAVSEVCQGIWIGE
jgi:hypothetical protein